MPELTHPGTRQPVNLIGAWVAHPASPATPEGRSSYFLIRHRDGTYEWSCVFDPGFPAPSPGAGGLRATRALRLSPFPEDGGRVFYLGGFDAVAQAGPVWHNTAWIYRALLPDETPKIQRTGANLTLPIDTAVAWKYQLQFSNALDSWTDTGAPLTGNNAAQSLLVTPTAGQPRQFYQWKISRP